MASGVTLKPGISPIVLMASFAISILGVAMPVVLSVVYDRIIPNDSMETLTILVLGLLVVILLEFMVQVARGYLMANRGFRYELDLRNQLIDHALTSDLRKLEAEKPGLQLNRISGVDKLRDHFSAEHGMFATEAPVLLVYGAALYWLSPMLFAVPVATLVLGVCAHVFLRRIADPNLQRRLTIDAQRHSFLLETLRVVEAVKTLSVEKNMERRYERLLAGSAETGRSLAFVSNATMGVQTLLLQMTPFAVICVGSMLVIQRDLSVGSLAAALILAPRMVQPALRLLSMLGLRNESAMRRKDLEDMLNSGGRVSGRDPCERIDELRLRDVKQYAPDGVCVLDGIDLTVKRGEVVGVTGPVGSGKSTLAWLLSGEIPPDEGVLLINGRPASELDFPSVRRRIALLTQRPSLLRGSIMENLSRFDIGSLGDEGVAIARRLGIEEVLKGDSDVLIEKTAEAAEAKLSAVMPAAISLVRGLVGRPDVIIFDEANLSLNTSIDERLMRFLDEIRKDRAIIMISRRPSCLRMADRIYQLGQGRLHEIDATGASLDSAYSRPPGNLKAVAQ